MADIPAYASKETAGHVRRSQRLSDILERMQSQGSEAYSSGAATNMNVIANALAQIGQDRAASRADEGLKADRAKASDMILAGMPGTEQIATSQLEGNKAFDLTPKGTAQRVSDGALGDRVRSIADYIGDPIKALQYGESVQERERERNMPIAGDKPLVNPHTFETVYTPPPEPTEAKPPKYSAQEFNGKVWMVNENDPKDKYELGTPNVKAGEGDNFGDEQALRGQYNNLTGDFRVVRDAYSRIKSLGKAETPAQQMGLVFGIVKMLDPTSTVREGEYATAQNTTGIPQRVMNAYNQAVTGNGLNAQQVKEFSEMADGLYKPAEQNYTRTFNHYKNLVTERGFSPNAIEDYRLPAEKPDDDGPSEEEFGKFVAAMPPSIGKFMSGLPTTGAQPAASAQRDTSKPAPGWDPEDWNYLKPDERIKAWSGVQ